MKNEELIKALLYCGNYEDREGCAEGCPYFCDGDCPKRIMLDAADALEAAEKRIVDAVPAVHGEWIEKEVFMIDGAEMQSARCSICRRYLTTPYMYYFDHHNYCPNCGAKMDGKEKEDVSNISNSDKR